MHSILSKNSTNCSAGCAHAHCTVHPCASPQIPNLHVHRAHGGYLLGAAQTLGHGSQKTGSERKAPAPRAPRCAPRAHRARTAQAFLATLFCIFQDFFRVTRTRWPKGYTYNNGGLHSSLLTKGGCSCPHPLSRGGRRKGRRRCRTLRYGRLTEEPSAPQGAQACGAVSNVSRFDMLLNGVPIPMMQPFRCARIGSFRVSIVTTSATRKPPLPLHRRT